MVNGRVDKMVSHAVCISTYKFTRIKTRHAINAYTHDRRYELAYDFKS